MKRIYDKCILIGMPSVLDTDEGTHCKRETKTVLCAHIDDNSISIPCCRIIVASSKLSSMRSTPKPPTAEYIKLSKKHPIG